MGKVEDKQKLAQKMEETLKADPFTWGQIFCPTHFKMRSPRFHLEIMQASMQNRFLSVAAPRESAKSTLLVFLYPLHGIMFKRFHFIVLVSNTFKKAAMHLESIKKELRDNLVIQQTLSPIQIIRDAEGDSEFRHSDGFTTKFLCKGVDQIGSIRGVKFGAHRPDLIICDDMEDDELVKNPERRKDLKEDYDTALIPAGERGRVQIINVGTILHDDCQMAKLINKELYPEFHRMIYRGHLQPDTTEEASLWPEKWSLDYLNDLRKNKPNVYAKEIQNDPVTGLTAIFFKQDFRYWKVERDQFVLLDEDGRLSYSFHPSTCKAAIACDLAWKENREADSTVIMPAFLTPNSDLLIDTYICQKGMRPDEVAEQLFLMVERLEKLTGSSVPVGFEKAMLENVTQWILKKEMRDRNKFLMTKELRWDADKRTRIETRLQPRYSQHVIYHKAGMGDLEHQLERFPSGAHDDLCFSAGTKISTLFGNKSIEEIKVGDLLITPFGIRKVINCGFTGFSETIEKFGLKATPNHKIFSNNSCFTSMDGLQCNSELNKLTFKELLLWRYKRLLNSMESNTEEWEGRKSIICLNQIQIKEGKILKDFMLQFGSFLIRKKYLKVFMFTTKMVIHLTMIFITLSVFHLANIIKYLRESTKLLCQIIWKKLDLLLLNGINQMKEENGIQNTPRNFGKTENLQDLSAIYADNSLKLKSSVQNTAVKDVETSISISKEAVFNLTVKEDGVFYANGILVSNCDSLQGVIQLLQYPKHSKLENPTDKFMQLRQLTIDSKLPASHIYRKTGAKKHKKWQSLPAQTDYLS